MKVEAHRNLSDKKFLKHFQDCTLEPSEFSHEAHLRLAYLHLVEEDLETAIKTVNKLILKYVSSLGLEEKYNRTLTTASVYVVNHFKEKAISQTFEDLLLEFPKIKNNFRGLLESHYSTEIFNNPKAKNEYLEPDLLSFAE